MLKPFSGADDQAGNTDSPKLKSGFLNDLGLRRTCIIHAKTPLAACRPENFLRGPLEKNVALPHDIQLISEGLRFFKIVCRRQDPASGTGTGPQKLPQFRATFGVNSRRRLVEEQEARASHASGSNIYATFEAAGEFVYGLVPVGLQSQAAGQFPNVIRFLEEGGRAPKNLFDFDPSREPRLLKLDSGDKAVLSGGNHFLTKNDGRATRRAAQSYEDFHAGCLAGTVWSHQHGGPTVQNLKGDVIHNSGGAVSLRDILEFGQNGMTGFLGKVFVVSGINDRRLLSK